MRSKSIARIICLETDAKNNVVVPCCTVEGTPGFFLPGGEIESSNARASAIDAARAQGWKFDMVEERPLRADIIRIDGTLNIIFWFRGYGAKKRELGMNESCTPCVKPLVEVYAHGMGDNETIDYLILHGDKLASRIDKGIVVDDPLNVLVDNDWGLVPVGSEDRVHWEVRSFYMQSPHERTVASGATPLEALRRAIKTLTPEEEKNLPLDSPLQP